MPGYEEKEFLEASEAANYLAERWGLPSYSAEAFKMLRHRWNIHPAIKTSNATLWRKSDLDKIEKPDRSRSRGKRIKVEDEEDGFSTSVILMSHTLACLEPAC